MARGRKRYLARAAMVAALIVLAAGCSSSSSSSSGASSSTAQAAGQTSTATGTSSASAVPGSGFVAIVEPFDPGHPARVRTVPNSPAEARLKATDSTNPSQLSWYTTPEGSRIAQINTQGDQAEGEIVAWVIIGGADGFVINPGQFYFINRSLTDYGIVQPPDPTYHRVGTGVEYTFDIDCSHLPAVPPAAVEGYVYVPGTPVAIWQ